MPDDVKMEEVEPKDTQQENATETLAGPRMRTALLIAIAYLAALAYSLQAPTLMGRAVGFMAAPLLVLLILTAWWLRSRGVPRRDRVLGLVLFAAVQVWILISHPADGVRLLMVSLPFLSIGLVLLLAATSRLMWRTRRRLAILLMVACAGAFTAVRVSEVSDIMPVLAWQWSPSLQWAEPPPGAVKTAVLPAEAGPGDWAEFRGPARDSRLPGTTFATDWEKNPPRELWRRPVGLGWSSFAAVGDYIFTQEQRNDDETVVCYRADNGDQVWVNRIDSRFDDATGSGPRGTPTYHEGSLYVFGGLGILQRLDASTGATAWTRDLKADTDAKVPVWGFASSPLVTGDLVVVFSGGRAGKSVAAYNRESGELVWSGGDGTHGYSSGHFARISDVPQILMPSDVGIQSFAPESGDILWEYRWDSISNPRCVQPLVADMNSIMIGTAGGQGTRRIRVEKDADAWTVEEQWATRKFRPYFNDFVYHKGNLYGYDGKRFTCIDGETGERLWTGDNYGGQVLLLPAMDTLLLLTQKGEVVLLEATPERHNRIAKFKALSGKTWNHPVIAHGKLFLRNSVEAACYELPS